MFDGNLSGTKRHNCRIRPRNAWRVLEYQSKPKIPRKKQISEPPTQHVHVQCASVKKAIRSTFESRDACHLSPGFHPVAFDVMLVLWRQARARQPKGVSVDFRA
jgi:hypothetical protein